MEKDKPYRKLTKNYSEATTPGDNLTLFGKKPPQAIELEEAILGAIMLERDAIDMVLEIFDEPAVFYNNKHQLIFESMLAMRRQYIAIDLVTVAQYLRKENLIESVDGAYYLTKLTNNVVSGAHIQDHSRFLYQAYMQRELIRSGIEMINAGYDDSTDVFESFDAAQQRLTDIVGKTQKGEVKGVADAVMEVMNRVSAVKNGEASSVGISSGFKVLDRCNNGWTPTDLIIIAARPAVGKTAFALNLARNSAISGVPTAMFSLEMSKAQLVERMVSMDSQIYMSKIIRADLGPFDMELFVKSADRVANLPLFIDDDPALKIMSLKSRLRKLVDKHKVKLVVVDYLQLMNGNGDKRNQNREQEISQISRELKVTAKQLNVAIIALSQLSRSVEQRTSSGNVPQLSDLRESGAIEQDADEVIFLYAPSEAAILQDASLKHVRNIKIAKDRDGQLEDFPLQFWGDTQTFTDYGQQPEGYIAFSQTNQVTYREESSEDEWDPI